MQVLFPCTPAQANVPLLICYAHRVIPYKYFLIFFPSLKMKLMVAPLCKLTFGMLRYLKGGEKKKIPAKSAAHFC